MNLKAEFRVLLILIWAYMEVSCSGADVARDSAVLVKQAVCNEHDDISKGKRLEIAREVGCFKENTIFLSIGEEQNVSLCNSDRLVTDGQVCYLWTNNTTKAVQISPVTHGCARTQITIDGVNSDMLYMYKYGTITGNSWIDPGESHWYTCDFRVGGKVRKGFRSDNGRLWGLDNGVYRGNVFWNEKKVGRISIDYRGKEKSKEKSRELAKERFTMRDTGRPNNICGNRVEKEKLGTYRTIVEAVCEKKEVDYRNAIEEMTALKEMDVERIWYLLRAAKDSGWSRVMLELISHESIKGYKDCQLCRLIDILTGEQEQDKIVVKQLCQMGIVPKPYDIYELATYGFYSDLYTLIEECKMDVDEKISYDLKSLPSLNVKLSAVYMASESNDWEAVAKLIDMGANVFEKNHEGDSAFYTAAETCSLHTLEVMLTQKSTEERNMRKALALAIASGCYIEARYLERQGAVLDKETGRIALEAAICIGSEETAGIVSERGIGMIGQPDCTQSYKYSSQILELE